MIKMSSCDEILQISIQMLKEANYHVFEYHTGLDLCFEILARHDSPHSPNLLIKVVENIDNVRPHYINELKIVSRIIEALPLLISIRNRHSDLENNSLYMRNGLIALNIYTFSQIIQQPRLPLAIAKQGGLFYDINGEKMESLRERQGITRNSLAEELQVSSKAVSQYEKNAMRASVENAKTIEKILGESVVVPLDFYTYLKDSLSIFKLNDKLQRRVTKKTQEFMKEINEIVEETGHQIYWTRTAPFDLFIYDSVDEDSKKLQYQFVGGTQYEKMHNDIHATLKREFLPEITQHKVDGAIIYNDEIYNEKSAKRLRVPYLFPKELRELEHPEIFKKIIRKRTPPKD